jgi:beta-glucanase (GH16 family)
MKKITTFLIVCTFSGSMMASPADPYKPDNNSPQAISGYKMVWNDEFNIKGKPDSTSWKYEKGFVRNHEIQWYQPENANCNGGLLKIEGRREKFANTRYEKGSNNWKRNRDSINYTAASINTAGLHSWLYGRFIVRARIPAVKGAWPAIWTLGNDHPWPSNGEIDQMEFYQIKNVPSILANVAWSTGPRNSAKWKGSNRPLTHFTDKDKDWANKFHIWRMDWDKDFIRLYLDDELLNEVDLSKTINPDGFNPFHQAEYILLNLAIGGDNGGDPSQTVFPIVYEVDYVRIYQKK